MLTTIGLIIISVTVIANLFISYAVYQNNSRSATHRLLATLSLSLTLWTIFNYLALLPGEAMTRLFWVRVVMVVTAPFGPLLYLLAISFPQNVIPLSKTKLYLVVGVTTVIMVLSLTPLVFADLKNLPNGRFQLTPGVGIALFGINFLFFLTLGFAKLITHYRRSTSLLKKQLGTFLTGTIMSFTLLTLTNFIAVVVFNTIELTFLGPPFTLIMVGFIAYAIVKHRFLEIRVIVARAFSYLLLIALLGFFYATALILFGDILLGIEVPTIQNIIIEVALILVIVFTFQPLKNYLTRATNRLFFQYVPSANEFLSEIGAAVTGTLDIMVFSREILKKLLTSFQIESGAFLAYTPNLRMLANEGGFTNKDTELIKLYASAFKGAVTVVDAMEESPLKHELTKMNLYAVLKFANKEKILGFCLLGDKKSGRSYLTEEERLLALAVPSISVGLNNTLQFLEIQQFSENLSEKVKDATKELRDTNMKLKDIDEKKNEFISMAAHELRAPLTAVRGFLSMVVEGDTGPISEKAHEFLLDSLTSSERMIRLVNNMLDVGRIEEGRLTINLSTFPLTAVLAAVHSEFIGEAMNKKLTFNFEKPTAILDTVYADEDKLHEVVVNLVSNAIKYTEFGTVTLRLTNPKPETVRVEVVDTGAGITKEEQKKLFQKFYRVQSNIGKTIGTGLGLYISKLLILRFGGDIGLNSESGKGSTFWFELPVRTPAVQG